MTANLSNKEKKRVSESLFFSGPRKGIYISIRHPDTISLPAQFWNCYHDSDQMYNVVDTYYCCSLFPVPWVLSFCFLFISYHAFQHLKLYSHRSLNFMRQYCSIVMNSWMGINYHSYALIIIMIQRVQDFNNREIQYILTLINFEFAILGGAKIYSALSKYGNNIIKIVSKNFRHVWNETVDWMEISSCSFIFQKTNGRIKQSSNWTRFSGMRLIIWMLSIIQKIREPYR